MHNIPLSKSGSQYIAFGKTAAGTQRYRCLECRKTFIGKQKSISGQRRSEKNRDVFILVVNRVPLSRIVETTTLAPRRYTTKSNLFTTNVACTPEVARRNF
jgi:transposase-like protein